LFVNPPLVLGRDFVDYPWFVHFGLLGAAARAMKAGADVRLADAFDLPGSGAFPHADGTWLGAPLAELIDVLPPGDFDAVVLGLSPFLRPGAPDAHAVELVRELRRRYPGSALVGADCHPGGMHYIAYDGASALAALDGLDAVVRFGGESVFGDPERLVALKGTGRVVDDPDLLPDPVFPALDLLDGRRYGTFLWRTFADGRFANPFGIDAATRPFMASTGCPHRCTFCSSNPGWRAGGRKPHRAVPLSQVEAWAYLASRGLGARKLFVMDDVANLRSDFEDLLDVFNRLDLRYEFPNGLRADRLTPGAIARMKDRVSVLSLSAESASAEHLAGPIGKRQDPDAVRRAVAWAAEAGVPTMVHYIIGFPWETPADVNATLAMAWDLFERHGARPAVQFATPLPGTDLWDRCAEMGLLSEGVATADSGVRFQHEPSFTPPAIPDGWLQAARRSLDLKVDAAAERKVIINITYECINNCRFCAIANRVRRGIPFERLDAILQEHRAQGTEALDIDGGEPTLHPDLHRTLARAVELGYTRINVTTNGRRLADPEAARALLATGLTSLSISLHGDIARVHDALTGVPGSFQETMAGIRNSLDALAPGQDFGVNVTITRDNVDRLERLVARVHKMGVRKVNLQFLTPFGAAQRDLLPDPDTATKAVARVLDRFGSRMTIFIVNAQFCQLPGYEAYLAADVQKLGRTMVFVTDQEVNLFDYLASRRVRRDVCRDCAYALVCEGFFEFGEGPSDA
jgi:MoaA/NifB/PqqE/SkfB family radical SAM enzyme